MAKISVFLDDNTHRKAKLLAMDQGRPLTRFVAELVEKRVAPKKKAAKSRAERMTR